MFSQMLRINICKFNWWSSQYITPCITAGLQPLWNLTIGSKTDHNDNNDNETEIPNFEFVINILILKIGKQMKY